MKINQQSQAKTKRGKILEHGIKLTEGDRNAAYGSPFNNLETFARLVNAYLYGKYGREFDLNAVDGSIVMNLAKVSRVVANQHHMDNYTDGAVYMAIAGECSEDV